MYKHWGIKVARKEFAVIDFGSSKIVLLVGFRTKDGIHVIAKSETEYEGFMEGEFLAPEHLSEIVSRLIGEVEKTTTKRITKLYVGVPDEMLVPVVKESELVFRRPSRIKEKHLTQLVEDVDLSFVPESHEVISIVPISYSLDQGAALLDLDRAVASKITAFLSIIAAEKNFLYFIQQLMQGVGVAEIEYLPTCLASAMNLIEDKDQKNGAILVDVGNVVTSVASVFNSGIVELKTFTSGGGFITSDLMSVLKINYFEADQLKRKTVLSMEATKDDYYEIFRDSKLVKFYSNTVNNIVRARVENIAEHLLSCIESFDSEINEDTKIYITGGGLGYIMGAMDVVAQVIGHKVQLACPKELQYFRPDYASSMSLLHMVLDMGN